MINSLLRMRLAQMTMPYRLSALTMLLPLMACSAGNEEVQAWIEDQSKEVRARVEPITAPVKFVPKLYEPGGGAEPFGSAKMSTGTRNDATKTNALMDAEMKRRREPLEAFPLDAISMVGSLQKDGQRFALIRVEQLLYHVKVGDYLGQNFGKITGISETEVSLREVVEDASGEWVERTSTLHIK